MSLILTGLFVLAAGAIVGGALMTHFWEKVRNWLNNVAADAVEKVFGYSARNNIQKAISVVDKIVNKIRNTSTIYTKKDPSELYFDKTTIIAETGIMDIDEDARQYLSEHNHVVQDFGTTLSYKY